MDETKARLSGPEHNAAAPGGAFDSLADLERPLRVLILEDVPEDAELMQTALAKAGFQIVARRADTKEDFVEALETLAPDVALLDCALPRYSGKEALAHIRHVHPEVPVVMVTGSLGDEAAIELLKAGAKDYVLKNNLIRLPAAVGRVISVEQGIRARKAAEHAVRKSEETSRLLIEAAPDAILLFDADQDRFISANGAAERLLGRSRAEITKNGPLPIYAAEQPDGRPAADSMYADVARALAGEVVRFERNILNRQGEGRICEGTLIRLPGGPGRLLRFSLVDITERHRAEEKIREEEKKFRDLVEQYVAGVAIIRQDGTIDYINPYFASVTGHAEKEVVGRSIFDFLMESEKAAIATQLQRQFAGQLPFVQLATSLSHKDGRQIDILVNASLGRYAGQPASTIVAIDVTERNRAAAQSRKLQGLLENAERIGHLAAWEWDIVNGSLIWSDELYRIYGRDPGEFEPTIESFFACIHPEDRARVQAAVEATMKGRAPFDIELRIVRPGGEERVTRARAELTLDSAGKPLAMVGSSHDITELKRAEQSLAESELKFRAILESEADGILVADAETQRFAVCNPAICTMLGYSADEVLQLGVRDIHPAEATPEALDDFAAIGRGDPLPLLELPLKRKDGSVFPAAITRSVMVLGGRSYAVGIFRDIARQKADERALARLNRALQTLGHGNEVVVRSAAEADLLKQMCQTIVETGGYRMAWLGMVRNDPEKSISPAAWAGEVRDFLKRAPISWSDDPGNTSPCGRAVNTGRAQVIRDFAADRALAPLYRLAREYGFQSCAAFPLKHNSTTFGILAIYAADPDAFDEVAISLLQELADDLSYGIRSLRDRADRDAYERRWRSGLEATVGAIGHAVEVRDPYTAGHQQRVAQLSVAIARELGLPEDETHGLYLASLIHDVGKITIPAEILNKPGQLAKTEFDLIKAHAQSGYEIVKDVDFPWPIAQLILQHHERLDGSGYPQGLTGDAILPAAKMLAVADVVEAMMSHRPYRAALGLDAALAEIQNNKGRLFDPAAVDACIALFREKRITLSRPAEGALHPPSTKESLCDE